MIFVVQIVVSLVIFVVQVLVIFVTVVVQIFAHFVVQKMGAVLRGGLKNGVLTTVAGTRWRTASIVTSNSSVVPGAVCGAAIVASAISFFSTGDHVVVVARPIWCPDL